MTKSKPAAELHELEMLSSIIIYSMALLSFMCGI